MYGLVSISTFLFMEFVAWFTHKYVMHGFLWYLHKDHHQKPVDRVMEKNDLFFLIFATPGIACVMLGMGENNFLFEIGVGISLYGLGYFFIHDLFIHQRLKVLKKTTNRYLLGVRRAHKIHHKNRFKENGECFGMLIVPFKYFRKARKLN